MAEKLTAFEHGVEINWTCTTGMGGDILLCRPKEWGQNQFDQYKKVCRRACIDCNFSKTHVCTEIGEDGRAHAEFLSLTGTIEKGLVKFHAPCVSGYMKIVR